MKMLFCALLMVFIPIVSFSEVRIITAEEPPTNYLEDGQIVGTTVDIVEGILDALHSLDEIEFMPWARAMKIASSEPNVAIFTAGRTQERIDHGFNFIGPVMTRRHVLWCKANKKVSINSIDDVRAGGYVVGALRGDWRGKIFKGAKVDVVGSPEQNPLKLLRDRIDFWVTSDIEAPPIMKSIGLDMNEIKIAYIIKEAPSFIMLSKNTSAINIMRWENMFTELQTTGLYEKIADKWRKKIGLNLKYAQEKGLYTEIVTE